VHVVASINLAKVVILQLPLAKISVLGMSVWYYMGMSSKRFNGTQTRKDLVAGE